MTENELKLKVMRYIKRNYPDTIIWKLSDRFNAGRPDLLFIFSEIYNPIYLDGPIIVFIELKRSKKELPRPLQQHILNELTHAGCNAFVVYSLDTLKNALSQCLTKGGEENGECTK